MPKRKETFENGEIYHIILKRIPGQLFFNGIADYFRGIFCIYELNTTGLVEIRECRNVRLNKNNPCGRTTGIIRMKQPERDKLVDVLCFCLMSNHIHLLLRQKKDGGISKFMQKIGSGYPRYFKKKHKLKETGHFFQEKFVSVHIEDENQLKVVFVYIHTNPVAIIEPNWKEKGIADPEKVIKFLKNYKWSSYQDYIGKKNFPSVTERSFLLDVMGGHQKCKEFVDEWIKYKGEIREFAELALE